MTAATNDRCAQAALRGNCGDDAEREAEIFENRTLLDVQFEIRGHLASRARRHTIQHATMWRSERVAQRDAVVTDDIEHRTFIVQTGEDRTTQASQWKATALFARPRDGLDRMRGANVARIEQLRS